MMPWYHRLYLIASGLVEIVEGAVKVLSLGHLLPTWSFRLMAWDAKRQIVRQIARLRPCRGSKHENAVRPKWKSGAGPRQDGWNSPMTPPKSSG